MAGDTLPPTVYINLDRRTDRRSHMNRQSALLQHPFERISAIDNGFMGCTSSHLQAVTLAAERQYPYVLILEDDFQLDVPVTTFKRLVCSTLQVLNQQHTWHVLMLNMTPIDLVKRGNHARLYRTRRALAMPAYIVHRSYYTRLQTVFQTALRLKQPCDLATQRVQPRDAWYGLYPGICRQKPGYSDLEKRQVNYRHLESGSMLLRTPSTVASA